MYSLSRRFTVREKPVLHRQVYKLLSHRPDLVEPVHEKVRKGNQRRHRTGGESDLKYRCSNSTNLAIIVRPDFRSATLTLCSFFSCSTVC